jgi:DMSO/TMAO reductase YedYZ molybdopterin-dependent catalytic subunit
MLRRHLLTSCGSAFAIRVLPYPLFAQSEQVLRFADTKPFVPEKPLLIWEELTSWLTPSNQLFHVAHYGRPEVDPAQWRLELGGLFTKPRSFTLKDLQALPRREIVTTLECSGNPPAGGMIGNCRWAGTPLVPLLKAAGIPREAIEVVFFGADSAVEKIRGGEYPQQFARSLSIEDALNSNALLAYELNGAPLDRNHGAPLRLVTPGLYGVAWVKWLSRIELHDRRFLGRFMGRDYVTIRGEKRGDQIIWRETSVLRMNLKSVVARAVRRPDGSILVTGAAWSDGVPIRRVEIRIDDGPWQTTQLSSEGARDPFTWRFWSYVWRGAPPGEHVLVSRAIDAKGRIQPAPDDPFISLKRTYWEANQQAARKLTV